MERHYYIHYTQVFGVVAAIIEEDGKFLLVKENMPGRPDHGKWNHPAGKIDLGEDAIIAMKRETKEETGYDFEPTALLGVYVLVKENLKGFSDDGGYPHCVKLVYTGKISGSEKLSAEISEIGWFTVPEIIVFKRQGILRDDDILAMAEQCLYGKRYPLDIVAHTVQKNS